MPDYRQVVTSAFTLESGCCNGDPRKGGGVLAGPCAEGRVMLPTSRTRSQADQGPLRAPTPVAWVVIVAVLLVLLAVAVLYLL